MPLDAFTSLYLFLHPAKAGILDSLLKQIVKEQTGIDIDNLTSAIQAAAKSGDLAAIKTLIGEGANINGSSFADSPLKKAIEGDHKEVVAFLVEKGADVNTKTKDGLTPLQLAVKGGNKDIIKILETALNKTED